MNIAKKNRGNKMAPHLLIRLYNKYSSDQKSEFCFCGILLEWKFISEYNCYARLMECQWHTVFYHSLDENFGKISVDIYVTASEWFIFGKLLSIKVRLLKNF